MTYPLPTPTGNWHIRPVYPYICNYFTLVWIGFNVFIFYLFFYSLHKFRSWIISLSFTLAFGGMFTKTWRVYSIIIANKTKRKVLITDFVTCVQRLLQDTWARLTMYPAINKWPHYWYRFLCWSKQEISCIFPIFSWQNCNENKTMSCCNSSKNKKNCINYVLLFLFCLGDQGPLSIRYYCCSLVGRLCHPHPMADHRSHTY